AVQGTKQVSAAIISSTLTTVCVFLPLVFTSGMVRQLLLPMGLSIGYCLLASLIVAMTVVPAAASTLLRNTKAKAHPWFDKMMDKYELSLKWCLKHKAIPLLVSVALLVFSVWAVMTTGIVLLPEMTSDSIQVTVRTPEGLTREESFAMSDEVIDTILKVEGVEAVGAMDSGSSSGLLGGFGGSSDSYGSYVYYIIAENGGSTSAVTNLVNDINAATADMEAEVMASAGGMSDMTALLGSGLSVTIYGNDLEVLRELSDDIIEIVDAQEGYTDASSSFTNGDPTIQLKIDKDLAMSKGLTVAQIYMEIASRLTTSATSTTVTIDGVTMDVTVENNSNPLTVENLMDIEFETTSMTATGESKKETYKLSDFASIQETTSIASISRENQTRSVTVSAAVEEGYNATLLSRELTPILQEYADSDAVPDGYTVDLGGESSTVNDMVEQMGLMLLLGCAFIYLIMVAQFQSLLSPFIVLFTVPLAFTGGMIALLLYGQSLSLLSLVGFVVLMGTVVNNGIVFVDYTNQLRIGGMERQAALIATGRTRMRPILMTAMTTILAMMQMIFADDMSGQMGGGMSVVIVGGLAYATLMTLYIIPVLYDIFFKRPPLQIDVGGDNIDDVPDDAAEFIAEALAKEAAQKAEVQEKEEDGE
ncbi:MAG: efflux RND transporter permease subunit, partial [Oscillospiraceae bacterium]|nr:efflux RND transporter permease subunit [Oscillospiraceae bacterium]